MTMDAAIAKEILDTLGRAFGPMRPREICDAMAIEATSERDLVFRTMREMAAKGRDVVCLDDGSYSLVPKEEAATAKPATLVERIDARLRSGIGDVQAVWSLLGEAREEIAQLTFAARAAIAATPKPLAIDLDRARKVAEGFGWEVDPDGDGRGLTELAAIINAGIGQAH